MKDHIVAVLAVAVAFTAQAARAKEGKKKADPEAIRVMQDFGRCVGESRTSGRLLATLPYSPEEQALASRISGSECMRSSGELRFRAPLLRGLVAEQLYMNYFAIHRRPAAPLTVFVDPGPSPADSLNRTRRTAMDMIKFGECVASLDSAGLTVLFKTTATTQREREAYAALQPAFGKCVESGVSFHLNPFTLRGFLAEGAYRHAVAEAQKPNA